MRKGFTLIELLVVIAIIGILATIALSATQAARNRGLDARGKSNAQTLLKGWVTHSADNPAFLVAGQDAHAVTVAATLETPVVAGFITALEGSGSIRTGFVAAAVPALYTAASLDVAVFDANNFTSTAIGVASPMRVASAGTGTGIYAGGTAAIDSDASFPGFTLPANATGFNGGYFLVTQK